MVTIQKVLKIAVLHVIRQLSVPPTVVCLMRSRGSSIMVTQKFWFHQLKFKRSKRWLVTKTKDEGWHWLNCSINMTATSIYYYSLCCHCPRFSTGELGGNVFVWLFFWTDKSWGTSCSVSRFSGTLGTNSPTWSPPVNSLVASATILTGDVVTSGDVIGVVTGWWDRLSLLFSARLAEVPQVASPCCVSAWRRRSTFLWKARPQLLHGKGLKPVCLRLCVMRLDDWLKALPHERHTYGFSPRNTEKSELSV